MAEVCMMIKTRLNSVIECEALQFDDDDDNADNNNKMQ